MRIPTTVDSSASTRRVAAGSMRLAGPRTDTHNDLVGCPQGTFPPDPSRIIPTGYTNFANVPNNSPSKGQLSFKFNKSGGYVVSFRALRGGSEVYLDEKPIRVGCGFAVFNSAASFSAASSTSTGEVAGPPIERMTGYRMSEQETSAPEGVEPQP